MSPTLDAQYRVLVQSVTDYAIYMLDSHGIVNSWNAGAERAKGYSAHEIIGQHFSRFYREEDRAQGLPARALQTAAEQGRFEGEGWRVRKDGGHFWAHVVIDPIRDDAGQVIGFAKITRDLTERRASQKKASDQERLFRLLVQGVTDYAIYTLDPQGHVSNWNAGAQRAKGYLAHEIVGQHFSKFYTQHDRDAGVPWRALATAVNTGKFEDYGWRVRQDGSHFWAHVIMEPIYDEDRSLIGFAKITQDLTDSKKQMDELTQLKERLDLAMTHMSQGLSLYDASETLVLCNSNFHDITDIPPSVAVRGTRFLDLLYAMYADETASPEQIEEIVHAEREQHLLKLQRDKQYFHERLWHGKHVALSHRALPEGGWVTTMDDVSERKRIEERIVHLAHHDSLTGLSNRNRFNDVVRSTLSSGQQCALLYLDLDRFKPINDSLGHPVGDEVLRQVADRIRKYLRYADLSARLGGDEFAVLLVGMTAPDDVTALATKLIDEISRPIQAKGFEVCVGTSIGLAFAPRDGRDADLLLRNADLALYSAKAFGRGCFRAYEPTMESVVLERRTLETDLRKALEEKQFTLHYQPVIDDNGHVVTSVEALLRWTHPVRGNVSPADFIGVAEEIGLMPEIGDWVLQTACKEAVTWPAHIKISVNLSTTQFRVPDLIERITHNLRVAGLPSERLELELTETAMITDLANTTEVLKKLRKTGVQVALDDFGTGYSSLSFLRSLPFTRIKIDRSFTQDLGVTSGAAAIIRAVTGLCNSLGVATTAEGVETSEQRAILREEGCKELQGYLISRPVPADEIKRWIAAYPMAADTVAHDPENCCIACGPHK